MSKANSLSSATPFAVSETLAGLGARLRKARLRRRLTMEDVAERIGVGVRAVRNAETGKATTSAAVYFSLLWLYDMLGVASGLADPSADIEGTALESARAPKRARANYRKLDNDF
jgi:transcriptional regulator with XRE-family HTH domain